MKGSYYAFGILGIIVITILIGISTYASEDVLLPTCTGTSFESLSVNLTNKVIINEKDEIVIDLNNYYGKVFFDNEYIKIYYYGKHGIIDGSCNIILEPIYDSIRWSDLEDYPGYKGIIVEKDEQFYFLDENEKLSHESFDDISLNLVSGILTRNTHIGLDLPDETMIFFNPIVMQDGKYGISDWNGNIIIPTIYNEIDVFDSDLNLIKVKKNNLYGIIDEHNEVVLPIIYKDIESVLIVDTNNKWGLLNRDGTILITPTYDRLYYRYVRDFDEIVFIVKEDELTGVLDYSGSIIIPIEHDEIYVDGKYFVVGDNELHGVFSMDNEMIIPQEYTYFDFFNGYLFAKKENNMGIIDYENNHLTEFKYDAIEHYQGEDIYGTAFVLTDGDIETIITLSELVDNN